MKRRLLAIHLVLVFLAGALGAVPVQAFVCRMSGAPVPVAEVEQHTCCSGSSSIDATTSPSVNLAHTACCQIAPTPEHPDIPALVSTSHFFVATVPESPSVFVPTATTPIVPLLLSRESAPRAPPGRNDSSRAPPFFS